VRVLFLLLQNVSNISSALQANRVGSKENPDAKKKIEADALYKRSRDNPSVWGCLGDRDKSTRRFFSSSPSSSSSRSFTSLLHKYMQHTQRGDSFFFGQVK
jgi:hypothetical protein